MTGVVGLPIARPVVFVNPISTLRGRLLLLFCLYKPEGTSELAPKTTVIFRSLALSYDGLTLADLFVRCGRCLLVKAAGSCPALSRKRHVPIQISKTLRIIPHNRIQIQRLRIRQVCIRHRHRHRRPVRRQKPPVHRRIIPRIEIIVSRLCVPLLPRPLIILRTRIRHNTFRPVRIEISFVAQSRRVAHPFSTSIRSPTIPGTTARMIPLDYSAESCPSLCGCPILRRFCEGWVFSVLVLVLVSVSLPVPRFPPNPSTHPVYTNSLPHTDKTGNYSTPTA